ncbi:hypothetical protein [Nocardiopsis synnemataformans]|uniref:hypothetical protein n=1 Tax=Nocardiopsis synnemataformans TaxID=61305 RepID=UPI003EB7F465
MVEHQHRMTLAADQRDFVEVERTTEDGVTHIVLSCLVGLTEVAEPERYEHPRNGMVFDLHVFEDGQGRRWHVATQAVEGMKDKGRVQTREGVTIETRSVPAREQWSGYGSQNSYLSREDLLTCLGDPETYTAMWDEVEARWERAAQAAAACGGVVERIGRPALVDRPAMLMDRLAYEAACRELGLVPASPQEILTGPGMSGEYTLYSYSLDHILYVALARGHRPYAEREQQDAQQRTLAQVDAAHPGQAYTRAEFEAACTLAGVDAPSDAKIERILSPYVLTREEENALLVALVERRARGMAARAQEEGRRCDECGRLIPGSGMAASLGLACGVDCYEAMADRPGRYASSHSV